MISAPAQGTRVPPPIFRGALALRLSALVCAERSRARRVALFEANSNFAWSARVNGGVASSGAGCAAAALMLIR